MSSRRALVGATTNDAISAETIRTVEQASIVNLFASCVTVTDVVGLSLDKTVIVEPGTVNIRAAALGMVDTGSDQIVFNHVTGAGTLRLPVTVTTSAIYLLSVEPIPIG